MVSIVLVATCVFFLTILFIMFTFSKKNHNIGLWIIIMLLFSLVMGYNVEISSNPERVHTDSVLASYLQ